MQTKLSITVIIPVYNEEEILLQNKDYFQKLAQRVDLIFVDGGSTDATASLIQQYGRFFKSAKGRSFQMNVGAARAQEEILLFLHADSYLPVESLSAVETAIQKRKCVGGCFRQVIDQPGLLFRWIALTGNMRARMSKIFYGDQAIFVRKDVFEKLGGFPEVELAEDVLFTKHLRCAGKINVLEDPVYCSARRWLKQGLIKTFLLNMRISFQFMFHCNTEKFSKNYQDIR